MAEKFICPSEQLTDSGEGVRFEVNHQGVSAPAFAIRYEGRVFAYINRCPHVPAELDWDERRFFDVQGVVLICSNHGATFLPESGRCIGGPCRGKSLEALVVEEREGSVFVKEMEHGRNQ